MENRLRPFLREHLRQRKLSYRDLAIQMKVSESTVKRIFTRRGLSLNELESICEALGISPADAILSAGEDWGSDRHLSNGQEEFMARNPKAAYFALRLLVGYSPHAIRNEIGLSAAESERILIQLEKEGFVRLGRKGTVFMQKTGPLRTAKDGPFRTKYAFSLLRSIVARLEKYVHVHSEYGFTNVFELYLTEASYANFQKEVEELLIRYRKRSQLDRLTFPIDSLLPVSGLFGISRFNAWKDLLTRPPGLPRGRSSQGSGRE